ncbi:hypothetical protein HispidOSU_018339, partial [Sigmodon hispidus]
QLLAPSFWLATVIPCGLCYLAPFLRSRSHTWYVQAEPGDTRRRNARWTLSSSMVLETERDSQTLQPVKTVASFTILANMSML